MVFSIGFPSPPTLNVSDNVLCFKSHSYYSINYYIIEIIDLINEAKVFNETSECISISMVDFPSECAPYVVHVVANNKVGNSNASNITLHGEVAVGQLDSESSIVLLVFVN